MLDFFMGANTPRGFVSRFDGLADPAEGGRLWVVKGGPGTGKSTLMKEVRAALAPYCREIHSIRCSADPGSLDAVVFPEHRLAIADGTPPHPLEPRYPGAFENVVSVCGCWDQDALYARRREIEELSDFCGELHREAANALRCGCRLVGEGRALLSRAVKREKLADFCRAFARREFPAAPEAPEETRRLLWAVTGEGRTAYPATLSALCPRLWVLEDDWGEVAGPMASLLRELALEAGLPVLTGLDPLAPADRPEAVLVPQLGVGFASCGAFGMPEAPWPGAKKMRASRFLDPAALREHRRRLSFLSGAAGSLFDQASARMQEARLAHDDLEKIYASAMDFEAVKALAERTAEDLLRAAHVKVC